MTGTAKIVTELRAELAEMKRDGIDVPAKAGWYISANWQELEVMRQTMTLAEVADYVCESARRL
ncbi:hypothetical protein [Caballeronia sp. GAFFF1]|uniref:hypothetical protein n=1 Tax=Caballeronia sp. GAFFF1 TaxID=2921779 RepID=UPI002028AA8B|nr:hypothetical protein [Caballeronia sp. GAFFF1]